MAIILIILGCISWIINANGWFIVPAILYKGLIAGGIIWLVLALLVNLFVTHKITKGF